MPWIRNSVYLLVAVAMLPGVILFPARAGDSADDKNPAAKSLDEQLLDELSGDLLDGLDDAPAAANDPETKAADNDDSELDQRLLDELGQGEDIGGGPETDPLTRIGTRMKEVEGLITQQQTSGKTQRLQEKIVEELAALIEQTKKQQQKMSGGPPSGGQPVGRQRPGKQPGQERSRPGTQSTDRVGKGADTRTELEQMRDLFKQVWGHLPERLRQQIEPSGDERFLPKYEHIIEEYFRRLAEEQASAP